MGIDPLRGGRLFGGHQTKPLGHWEELCLQVVKHKIKELIQRLASGTCRTGVHAARTVHQKMSSQEEWQMPKPFFEEKHIFRVKSAICKNCCFKESQMVLLGGPTED